MFYGKSYTVLVDVQGGAGWHHPATVGVQQAPEQAQQEAPARQAEETQGKINQSMHS